MDKKIYVTKPVLPPIEEFVEYLENVWETHDLTNFGTYTKQLMLELMDFFSEDYLIPMCNGHMALEMTLQAMELSGEVITTPYTFASTTHAIVRNGLNPVFCDVRESDCTIDVDKIEALITEKTSAIVPVHVYGIPCDIERIEAIAKKHNLKVIYDAAHAFGETVNGKSISSFGDASMFSFHATKAFNTIEGGCSVVRDIETLTRIYQLHNFGIMGEESVEFVGANAKMNEFQAIMGLCNLKHFEENRQKRKRLFGLYIESLKNVEGIRLLSYDDESVEYNYTYCPIFVDENKYGKTRNELYQVLKDRGIFARKYFYPITNEFACYKECGFSGNTPIAKKLSEQVLTLPLYSDLSEEDVVRITDIIKEI